MAIWDLDKLYFDDTSVELHHDQGGHYDQQAGMVIEIESEVSIGQEQYRAVEDVGFDIIAEWEYEISYSKFLDLIKLVPEKFRESEVLVEYLQEVGIFGGIWLSKTDELAYLLDPYSVEEKYITYLADLIGLRFVRQDWTPFSELKRQLLTAVDWYKMKGTYAVFPIVAYLAGIHLALWDMYCDSEANYNGGLFERVPWFVGNEGQNPPGLDSSFFKTPHFGIQVLLNKVHDLGSSVGEYLWRETLYTSFTSYIEEVRPVNTVPHYGLLLAPKTTASGQVRLEPGNIKTQVKGDWDFMKLYFDQTAPVDVLNNTDLIVDGADTVKEEGTYVVMNDGKFFDYTETSTITNITRWVLGTGSKGMTPSDSSWVDLEVPVLSGTIDQTEIFDDRAEYTILLNSSVVQNEISELGLYLNDGTTLRIASLFPDIDKHLGVELEIIVTLYRA